MAPNATVSELRAAITALEPDAPIARPGKWFETQQEHWLGWFDDCAGPGASTKMQAAGCVRKLVPWETVARALPERRRGVGSGARDEQRACGPRGRPGARCKTLTGERI